MNVNNSRLYRTILVFVCANHDEMIHVAEDIKRRLSQIDAWIEDNRCMTYSISKCNTSILTTCEGLTLKDFLPTDVLIINNKYIPSTIEAMEKECGGV